VTAHSNDASPVERRSFLNATETRPGLDTRHITDRQLECLAWVQQGKSASDIGGILGLSGRTVEKHIIKVCGHLGVKTRIQAVVRARELGLIAGSAA
jgi:DNA-binding CsgD family transcriptional regulator